MVLFRLLGPGHLLKDPRKTFIISVSSLTFDLLDIKLYANLAFTHFERRTTEHRQMYQRRLYFIQKTSIKQ